MHGLIANIAVCTYVYICTVRIYKDRKLNSHKYVAIDYTAT